MSVSVLMSVFGMVCIYDRFCTLFQAQGVQIVAAGLAMPDGITSDIEISNNQSITNTKDINLDVKEIIADKSKPTSTDSDTDTDLTEYLPKKKPTTQTTDEQTYPITEYLYRESNESCENFYIKNATELSPKFSEYLNASLPFNLEQTNKPQVLIVHTHTTESYMEEDNGYYCESFYPMNSDDSYNMIKVGNAIADSLTKNGIGTVHCCTHHDYPDYYKAYENCAASINEYLEKYPSIKLVLDIHRDSITTDENEKIKPTFEYNGRKAAQVMIMCGNDNFGYYDFPNWEDNLNLALKLQSSAENSYSGMTRPLYFGNFMYNMNIGTTSLLIEVGTDANTLEEAVLSGELLGNAIADVLKTKS